MSLKADLIPIQDEPEGAVMLGCEHPHGRRRKVEFGVDWPVCHGSEDIRFEAQDRQQLYDWVEQVLVGREYGQLGKAARGLVRRYIEKMSGLSRAQVTR